jgi:hypothetical protein
LFSRPTTLKTCLADMHGTYPVRRPVVLKTAFSAAGSLRDPALSDPDRRTGYDNLGAHKPSPYTRRIREPSAHRALSGRARELRCDSTVGLKQSLLRPFTTWITLSVVADGPSFPQPVTAVSGGAPDARQGWYPASHCEPFFESGLR